MATYEHKGRLTYKDEHGDLHRLYPVTKMECIEDFTTGESVLYTPQILTDDQKTQARDNIGVNEEIAETLLSLNLINPISDEDGSLSEDDGTVLVVRNDDIFLPDVTEEDDGGVLKVVDGKWKVDAIEIPEMPEINYPVTSVDGKTGDVVLDAYETKEDASAKLTEAKEYTDAAVANLVNSAPETLDTLGELAAAFESNDDMVAALDSAITNKADRSELFGGSWNDLTDKPFYEENNQTTIEWDGGTDGRESFVVSDRTYYKISDNTPTADDIAASTFELSNGESVSVTSELFTGFTNGMAKIGDYLYVVDESAYTGDGDLSMTCSDGIYVCVIDGVYPSMFTYGVVIIHQLDPKFLPLAEGSYGWEEKVTPTIIRAASDTVIGTAYLGSSPCYYMVSESTPSWEDLTGATIQITDDNGVNTIVLTEDIIAICKENSYKNIMELPREILGSADIYIILEDNYAHTAYLTFPKKGVYIVNTEAIDAGQVVTITYGDVVIHKIDKKFLPETLMVTIDLFYETASHSPEEIEEAHNAGRNVVATDNLNILYDLKMVRTNSALFEAVIPEESEVLFTSYIINPDKTVTQHYGSTPYLPGIEEEDNGKIMSVVDGKWALTSVDATSWNDLEDKPFGDIESNVTLVDGSFETQQGTNPDGTTNNIYGVAFNPPVVLEEGETYRVIVDGEEYIMIAKTMVQNGLTAIYLGNIGIDGVNEDTGEDICVAYVDATSVGAGEQSSFAMRKQADSVTLFVGKQTTVCKQLDEKFIPDTIARVSDIPEAPVTSVNGQTGDVVIDIPEGFSGSWNDLTDKPFGEAIEVEVIKETSNYQLIYEQSQSIEEGRTYAVYYDGKRYECVAVSDDYGYPRLEAEPFKIIDDGGGTGYREFTDGGTHTISVFELTSEVTLLPEEYIPDTIARTDNVNSMIDTKMSAAVKTINGVSPDINGNVNTERVLDLSGKLLNCVLPEGYPMRVAVTETLLSNKTLTEYIEIGLLGLEAGKAYTVIWDGAEYPDLVATRDIYGVISLPNDLPFTVRDYPDDGYGYINHNDEECEHTITILAQTGTDIVPMSETFIPDTIARAEDITAPRTEFILNSSTEGSTKKFKITIDDEGVLTATEIVESEA